MSVETLRPGTWTASGSYAQASFSGAPVSGTLESVGTSTLARTGIETGTNLTSKAQTWTAWEITVTGSASASLDGDVFLEYSTNSGGAWTGIAHLTNVDYPVTSQSWTASGSGDLTGSAIQFRVRTTGPSDFGDTQFTISEFRIDGTYTPPATLASFTGSPASGSTVNYGKSGATLTGVFSGGAMTVTPGSWSTWVTGTPQTIPQADMLTPGANTWTATCGNSIGVTYTISTPSVGPPAFSPSSPVTVGEAVTVTNTVTNADSPYNAATFSGGTGSWASNVFTPSAAGTFTITATIYGGGYTNTASLVVYAAPTISAFTNSYNGAGTATVPYGQPFTLTGTFNAQGGSASIDQGVGTVTTGTPSSSVTANWSTGGTPRTFTLTVVNPAGRSAGTVTQTVTITPQIVSVSTPTGNAYQTVSTSQSFGGGAVSGAYNTGVAWSASGPGGAGSWVGSTWTAPGTTGTYTITATSVADGTKYASTSVSVVAAPSVSISASTTSPLYGATSTTVTPTFTGSSCSIGTSPGTGNISANATSGVAITVQGSGFTTTTTYYARAYNLAGATSDASVTITVQTVTMGNVTPASPTLYVGATQTFSATVSGAVNTNVNWTASGGSFSPTSTASGANTTWTAPGTPGTYTITATSASGSGTTKNTTAIVVSPWSASPTQVQSVTGALTLEKAVAAALAQVQATTGGLTVRKDVTSTLAQVQSVSADLTTRILFAVSPVQLHTVAADLYLEKAFAGGVPQVQALAGDLFLAKALAVAAVQDHVLTGDLTTTFYFAALPKQVQSITGDLTVPKEIAAGPAQVQSITGALTLAKAVAASLTQAQATTADITTRALPVGSLGMVAALSGDLTTRALLVANAAQQQGVTAVFLAPAAHLQGALVMTATTRLNSGVNQLSRWVLSGKIARDVQQPERRGTV